MNRREFFELTGCLGLAATSMPALAQAQSGPSYDGPLFLSIHCGGGWDPTSFSDPKGREAEDQPNPMNYYLTESIRQPTLDPCYARRVTATFLAVPERFSRVHMHRGDDHLPEPAFRRTHFLLVTVSSRETLGWSRPKNGPAPLGVVILQ